VLRARSISGLKGLKTKLIQWIAMDSRSNSSNGGS
jgi:hypothetical protein